MRPSAAALNESPSEKEGKSRARVSSLARLTSLNESPSEKEGKSQPEVQALADGGPQ